MKLLHAAAGPRRRPFRHRRSLWPRRSTRRQLGAAFHDRRDKAFIATKFGPKINLETGAAPSASTDRRSQRRRAGRTVAALAQAPTTSTSATCTAGTRPRPIEETVERDGRVREAGQGEAPSASPKSTPRHLRGAANDPSHRRAAIGVSRSSPATSRTTASSPRLKETGATRGGLLPLGRGMLAGLVEGLEAERRMDFRAVMAPRFTGRGARSQPGPGGRDREGRERGERRSRTRSPSPGSLQRSDNIVTIPGTTKIAEPQEQPRRRRHEAHARPGRQPRRPGRQGEGRALRRSRHEDR